MMRAKCPALMRKGSENLHVVVVVYQCTIINLMVSLGKLKLFSVARFTLC